MAQTPEEKRARKAEYRRSNKAKIAESDKAYRLANKDKISAQKKQCRGADKERKDAYRKANKVKNLGYQADYMAQLRAARRLVQEIEKHGIGALL